MAISERYNKNLAKVQDILDGNHQSKISVGYSKTEETRKVGDTWTDADGYQWEQKDGYRVKKSGNMMSKGFANSCSKCEQFVFKSYDKATYSRTGRCYYCQIDWEEDLKCMRIGETNNKHFFWVRLMELQKWIAGRNELEDWIEDNEREKKNAYDMSIANAMANDNVSMEIRKNTQ